LQAFTNLGSFEKKYTQEHTNSHLVKSRFGPQQSCFGPQGSENPRLGTTALE